jgi:hypothetical protein
MNARSETRLATWLFNPFLYLAGAKALLIGWAVILLAGVVGALSRTHFDGVLDIHTGMAVPMWFFICEGFIAWLCLSVALLIAGKITAHTAFRVIDLAGTQALARWPTIIVSLIALAPGYQRFTTYLKDHVLNQGGNINFVSADAFVFFIVVLITIGITCWMVFLMYKAYSVSCNLTGVKAVVAFIVAMFAAEICSKAILYWLLGNTRQIG